MSQQMQLFEGHHEIMILTKEDVNFEFKGDFIISASHTAAVLEYQGKNATGNVLKFCKADHIYTVTNSNLLNQEVRKLHNTGEKFISNLSLNRVLGQSAQPKAEKFQDWLYEDALPSIQTTGYYTTSNNDSHMIHFKKEAYMIEVTANVLRLPDSGKLKLLGDFTKKHKLDVPLPAYVDEQLTESATELLKKHNVRIRTNAFNVLLINQGLLEIKERPSSKGGTKEFKSLTDAGLAYGKNIITPTNVRETQPHYYADTFEGLLKKIGLMPVNRSEKVK